MLKAAALVLLASVSAAKTPGERHTAIAKQVLDLGWAGKYAELDAHFDKNMRDAFKPEMRQVTFQGLKQQYGAVKSLGPARTTGDMSLIPVRFERGILDLKVVIDARDKIAGLFFQPHAAEIEVPKAHKTVLRPPFKGKWLVFWGGDTQAQNGGHIAHPNQRGAFDLLGVGPDGKTAKGDGTKNEDFYAFGREVLAPADGVVTDVISGVRDNVPGSMNQYAALGNAVVIKHRDLEYSVLAHLKQDSVRVKPGDAVKAGDVLGLCGNSGNSSEPHLHYHLQNTPVVQDGTGIKVFFDLKGKKTSPVKGDIVDAP